MFGASKTATPSGGAKDPQFNYVTMLLHGDGTNGAQNNTFLDSSSNAFTITRNGNTTQGSFSPYGSNWSNNFAGNGNYLTIGTSTNLALGAGDFTFEVWLYVTAYNASTSVVADWRTSGGVGSNIPVITLSATGVPTFYASVGSGALITGSSAVPLNTWTHLALVRNGSGSNNVTMYLNGSSVGTATNTANLGIETLRISDPQGTYGYIGYFSNARIVKGTAVYTGTFTPPTAPLSAIANTQLLTCQSNRFIDNSSNAFAVTPTGTPSVQRFNPFGTSTAYSTATIGGSGYFDGSGDYLDIAYNSALSFAGDFTIEGWTYITTAIGSDNVILELGGYANGVLIAPYGSADTVYINGTNLGDMRPYIKQNSWFHFALVRSGSTGKFFVNGVQVLTASVGTGTVNTGALYTGRLRLGCANHTTNYLTGYETDIRVVNGTALYSATFTPPTAPLAAISNTQFLENFTNGAIYDNSMMNDLETVGNAQISTSVKKYGTGSLAFDGTDDRLTAPSSANISTGTGDFTIEGWSYNAGNTHAGLFQISTTAGGLSTSLTNTLAVGMRKSPVEWQVYANGTTTDSSGQSWTTNTWYHFAIVRSSGTTKLYVNGTAIITVASDTTNYTCSNICVGGYYSTSFLLNGYIDDLRITKGYARYTTTFTPPTQAFPNTGPN